MTFRLSYLKTSVVGIRYRMPATEVCVYNSSMSKYMVLVCLLSSFPKSILKPFFL